MKNISFYFHDTNYIANNHDNRNNDNIINMNEC